MKINNLKNLINQFCIDAKEFSFGVAIGRFRKDFPLGKWEKRRTFYENRVYKYLEKRYAPLIKSMAEEYDESKKKPVNKKLIWVMWWQGEESMPEVVKICYNRLRSVAADCEIHLITQDNYNEYVNLPVHIIDKLENKKITLTHFSDILRVNLLSNYGGAWIDATVYVEYLPRAMFEDEFYTLHAPNLFPEFLSRGDWTPYLLSSNNSNYLLFEIMCAFFSEYWKRQELLIDYLLVDFVIALAKNIVPSIELDFEKLIEDREYYCLNQRINSIFNEDISSVLSRSPLQKLTYKKELLKYDNRQLTNYGWISERDNNE